jgi:hypothetical protein
MRRADNLLAGHVPPGELETIMEWKAPCLRYEFLVKGGETMM